MSPSDLPHHVEETVRSVAELHERFESEATAHQRAVESITRGLARPALVYVVLGFACVWIAANALLGWLGLRPLDPYPYGALQALTSLSALIMTVLILTTESRIDRTEERRARLLLQLSLLIERETTKTIDLLEQLRRDDPHVPDRHDPQAEALIDKTDVSAISHALERRAGKPTDHG